VWVCECVSVCERQKEGEGERGRPDDGTGKDRFKPFSLPGFVMISTQTQPSFV